MDTTTKEGKGKMGRKGKKILLESENLERFKTEKKN